METEKIIYFYGKDEIYGEFSNFSPFGIEMDGIWWKTVEHYFQAQKFIDKTYAVSIAKLSTPKEVFLAGQNRKFAIHQDWEQRKDQIMYEGVKKKALTHQRVREVLLSTGWLEIQEAAPHDYYWGVGGDGSGQNKLGKIWMRIRGEIS